MTDIYFNLNDTNNRVTLLSKVSISEKGIQLIEIIYHLKDKDIKESLVKLLITCLDSIHGIDMNDEIFTKRLIIDDKVVWLSKLSKFHYEYTKSVTQNRMICEVNGE